MVTGPYLQAVGQVSADGGYLFFSLFSHGLFSFSHSLREIRYMPCATVCLCRVQSIGHTAKRQLCREPKLLLTTNIWHTTQRFVPCATTHHTALQVSSYTCLSWVITIGWKFLGPAGWSDPPMWGGSTEGRWELTADVPVGGIADGYISKLVHTLHTVFCSYFSCFYSGMDECVSLYFVLSWYT